MANRVVSVALRADIGQYVSGMTRASASTAALGQSVDGTTKKTRSGFDMAGKGALLLGGAVVAGMGMAISKSMEFEKSMSAVSAATGATAATLGDLREAAMRAGADTQYSAKEAADAITEMAKAGVSAKDIMGGGLTGALSLAAAGQLDVAEAAEIASVAMTQFNLSGEDLPHVADLLAAGAGKAMGSVDDLGQALNQAGLIASAAGLNIEETTGGLAAFASAGLIGSDAGTSFKTMLQALQAPSGKSAELMAELGINMYDANGNMLGLSDMAGVLQSSLGDLTEEQRNAALAQIFGSDAVRAANVLYREGAAGIADWTAKVNDQGYAADQAAKLNDNLAGDLERLGGSFDTLMITLGEGAQGPLRELVQGLGTLVDGVTWLVEAWDTIPGPVQAGLAALVAFRVASGPVTSAISALSAAATAAGGPLGLLRSGAGGLLSALGGPVGLAIAGVTVGLGFMVTSLVNAGKATVDTAGYQQDLASALRESNGAIDENIRALAAKMAAETEISDDSNLLEYARAAGVDLSLVTDALLGNAGAAREVSAAFDDYVQVQALAAQKRGEDSTVIASWTELNNRAKDAIAQMNPVLAEAQQGNTDLAEAERESGTAAQGAATAQDQFAASTEAAQEQVDEAKKAVDAFKLSLDILTGAHVSMIQVESAFQAAVAEADGALEGMNGAVLDGAGNLNLQSESGRQTADVLLGVRDSGNDLIATMLQQGYTTDEVRAKDAELRESFIRSAMQMGISREAALRLADQILGIPAERNTRITADTGPAVAAIDGLIDKIRTAGGRIIYTAADVRNSTGVSARATGGIIYGPGTGTSDSILGVDRNTGMATSFVSAGEFVVNKKATDDNRQLIEAINAGQISQRDLPLFAGGGILSGAYQVPVGLSDSMAARLSAVLEAKYAAAATGPLGGGAVGGGWQSIWNHVKAAIPQARINSTYRPGDPGYHGRGKAVDFGFGSGPGGNGSAGLASINRYIHDTIGGNLAELIYDGIGDDRPDLKNGRPLTYSASTRAQHHNHVHAAVYHDGTDYVPRTGFAYLEQGEAVIPARMNPRGREFSGVGGVGGGGSVTIAPPVVKVFLDGQEWRGMARVEAEGVVYNVEQAKYQRGQYNS